MRNHAKTINTSKSTSLVKNWLSVWETWCKGKSIALEIREYKLIIPEILCQSEEQILS